ncbi:MAG: hypothetical protein Q7T73_15380, partial [Beijerinckiaceae bacterium]|nr:hypothetical protein [Beijerinckiaceae bacterium]
MQLQIDQPRYSSADAKAAIDAAFPRDDSIFSRLNARLATMEDCVPRIVCDAPPLAVDDRPTGLDPYKIQPAPFVHRSVITLFRDGRPQTVRGPVEPRALGGTPEAQARHAAWQARAAEAEAKRIADAKAASATLRTYFDKRRADKAAEAESKYTRACERAARHGKPVPERPEPVPPPDDWQLYCPDTVLVSNISAARLSRANAKRLERYDHYKGLAAGRLTDSFKEMFDKAADGSATKALRTALGIEAFQLFNSCLPKNAEIVYGSDKTTVYRNGGPGQHEMSGLSVRDMEYIESDRMRRTLFVVDLDGWWPNVEALWNALRAFLPPEFMPNLVSYRGAEDRGGVESPHLFFPLPPTARVIAHGKQPLESFLRQRNLHSMVQKGIVSLLIPLGADPDHHNTWKFKNPLSPKWSVVANDDHFATIDEWRAFLPTITPDQREMKRRAKIVKAAREGKSPDDVTLSGAIFSDGYTSRRLLI